MFDTTFTIAESEDFLAFLDVKPVVRGHVLVIPKRKEDYIFDLTDAELSGLVLFAKQVAIALKKAMPCVKVALSVIGIQTRHVHIHLLPVNEVADVNFTKERLMISNAELQCIADQIQMTTA